MKKSVVFTALLGLVLGFYSPIKAGPVVDPPTKGGGDSGTNISTSSLWGSDWANGFVSGPIVVQDMSTGVYVNSNPNPVPGNIGWFGVNVWASGMFYKPGDPTPSTQTIGASSSLRTNEVHSEPWPDGGEIILFDQTLSIDARGNSGSWINLETGDYTAWLSGNFDLKGGVFTNVDVYLNQKEWIDTGPKPSWFHDWDAHISASGIITSPIFSVAVVPEPATLGLFAISGAATLLRRKRNRARHRDHNLIA
ncbi:MAG TPA: PEP-CTERM sorting domain-containing protein [Candidatus Paceibacterota bacterium]